LLGLLLLSFSKGLHWFTPTYEVRLRATTVAGLKSGSLVLMSGVEVGRVTGADVAPDGKGVRIQLEILQKYSIHADARFVIEQIGFLGDQYVAIYPRDNGEPILKPGDEVTCEEPFNIQEVVRSTTGLIQRVDESVRIFNQAMLRLDRTVLSEHTLTNLQVSFDNFRALSERTLSLADHLDRLIQTNAAPASVLVSNLVHFSETIDRLAAEVRQVVAENRPELSGALKKLDSLSTSLGGLIQEVEAGKGLAGAFLKDEQLKQSLRNTVTTLDTLSSNLNRFGLLYKPKQPKTKAVPALLPPKNPFE